ncbi:hypothetical protein ACQU0X_08375 [Pseudovibrio ascidiaceicola]|uniref:hypothetical protein n=1 Tax=Pseudovibrio ascidiaceicola TaxID=285279 RepID=UPI003D360CFA
MAQKRQKKEQFFSPVGVFKYCHLNKPDSYNGSDPRFSVTVVLDKDEPATKALMEKLDSKLPELEAVAKKGFANASPKSKGNWKKQGITAPNLVAGYEDEYDDDGNPTGNIIIRAKTFATFTDKDGVEHTKIVPLIDGMGEVIPAKKRPLVYGGTIGRIAFTVGYTFIATNATGFLSLYLNQVQIKKLKTTGGGSSAFGALEDSDFSGEDLEEYGGRDDDGDTGEDTEAEGAGTVEDEDEIPF